MYIYRDCPLSFFGQRLDRKKKINWREDHKRIDHKAGLRGSAPSMLNICRHRLHYSQKVDQGAAERQQESISRGAKCRWRCVGLNFNSYEWISLNRAEKISSITLRCRLPSVFRLFVFHGYSELLSTIKFIWNIRIVLNTRLKIK